MSTVRHTLGSIPTPHWHRPFLRYFEGDQGGGSAAKPETGSQSDLEKALAEVDKWKAMSRKNEDQARSNAEKAKRFDEIEEANRSELEKLTARAEAAEAKIAEREKADAARKLADEVAEDKGVSASVLRGSTREELEAHADEILALIPAKPKAATDGTGGARGEDIDSQEELKDTTPGMGSLRAGYETKRKE